MERLPVTTVGVRQRDQRVDDVVDRDDVGAAGVGQQDGGQRRQDGKLGQHAEEVVRPVHLVHLAGARIAHDHRRAVDAMAQAGRRTHQQFGLELGLVIGRRQSLADVEVVLGVFAAEVTRHGDRRDMVHRRAEALRQGDHRAGALDIGGALLGLAGGDVVDCRAVHHVVDLAQLGEHLVAQVQLRQLGDQRFDPIAPLITPRRREPFEAAQRPPSHQHPHLRVGPGLKKTRHDAATDKPGTAGNDIPHEDMVASAAAHVNCRSAD